MKKTDMLPGLTAEQWSRPSGPLGRVGISLALISGAAYFISGSTAATVPGWLYALFAVTIANYFVAMYFLFALMVKAHR
ncbi:hypothetical protein, partial [Cryobacterium sp. MLB-32]|uniref:hypothetical protein n=1 Tax=Cryobacterium sp. MLB-32 TaxID=1529318 RepID=UPI001E2EADBD